MQLSEPGITGGLLGTQYLCEFWGLKALLALAGHLSSIPCNHMGAQNCLSLQFQGLQQPLDSVNTCVHVVHTHTRKQNTSTHKIKINKSFYNRVLKMLITHPFHCLVMSFEMRLFLALYTLPFSELEFPFCHVSSPSRMVTVPVDSHPCSTIERAGELPSQKFTSAGLPAAHSDIESDQGS